MSVSPAVAQIFNHLGGQGMLNTLMSPKMFTVGDTELGIRLKRANKDKINHIHISEDEGAYKIVFWSFPKDIMSHKQVAMYGNVQPKELKTLIEKHTNFSFPKCDHEVNKEKANIILEQIGGLNRINAMLGIEKVQPVDYGVSVTFKVGAADGINTFEITQDPMDTYTVKYFKITNGTAVEIDKSTMIYCDMLIKELQDRMQVSLVMPKFA